MRKKRIDQKDYKYYVFNPNTQKIITGWEYRDDAYDFIKETDYEDLLVYTRTYLAHQLDIDPIDNQNWGTDFGATYPIQPEMVFFGNVPAKIQIPEIKIRYNKGKMWEQIKSSQSAALFIKKIIGRNIGLQENFVMLLFDNQLQIIGYYMHTIGTPTQTIVDVPMIMGIALKALARRIIVSHNHPSGSVTPSEADISLTKALSKAATANMMKLLDHIIVTPNDSFYSFADEGNVELMGINGYEEKVSSENIEKRLRKEIFEQLKKATNKLTPHIYNLLQTPSGYAWIEQRIINMVIRDKITVSACIPQIENELE